MFRIFTPLKTFNIIRVMITEVVKALLDGKQSVAPYAMNGEEGVFSIVNINAIVDDFPEDVGLTFNISKGDGAGVGTTSEEYKSCNYNFSLKKVDEGVEFSSWCFREELFNRSFYDVTYNALQASGLLNALTEYVEATGSLSIEDF